jgi:hypothetical protein
VLLRSDWRLFGRSNPAASAARVALNGYAGAIAPATSIRATIAEGLFPFSAFESLAESITAPALHTQTLRMLRHPYSIGEDVATAYYLRKY